MRPVGVVASALAIASCSGSTDPTLPTVAVVEVIPAAVVLSALGETIQLTAVAKTSTGDQISGAAFSWGSSDPLVATVDANGLVTAVAVGEAPITATTDGVSGSANILVFTDFEPDRYYALDSNDLGQIVGFVETALRGTRAVMWTSAGEVTDLGTLGGRSTAARAINANGHVVGQSDLPEQDPNAPLGDHHAFLWTPAAGMTDLGTLGGTVSAAGAISDAGHVVGQSTLDSTGRHPFLWTTAGGMTDLGTLGIDDDAAFGVNSLGEVVGQGHLLPFESRGFLWTAARGMIALGTLGGVSSSASDINDLGQIVGSAQFASQNSHAVIWTVGDTIAVIDIGTLGGAESHGSAINASGDVAGWSATASGEAHAFIWTAAQGMTDLGTLGGDDSRAYGINNLGEVVGSSTTASGELRAFLWTPGGGMTALGTLAPQSTQRRR